MLSDLKATSKWGYSWQIGETCRRRALFWGDWFPWRKVTGHRCHTEELARRQTSEVLSNKSYELVAAPEHSAWGQTCFLIYATSHLHKKRDGFRALLSSGNANVFRTFWWTIWNGIISIWIKKQHLDLHLLFSHNQDSYKYLLRGQNHRSSLHCSQIKGRFWLPGHDECTIIKQFHNQAAFP